MLNQAAALPNQVLLTQVSLSDIYEGIRQIIREEILADKTAILQDTLLSPAETCKLFKPPISKPTLTSWTKKGLLKDYPISGRVYYKYSEVMAAGKHLTRYKNALF